MSSKMLINNEVTEVIITLINRMAQPKQTLRSLDQLKDGKCLCLLIIKSEWNKVMAYLSNINPDMNQFSITDIDMDFLYERLPHKIYAVIEKFIKKHFGFDYVISHSFTSGHISSIYQISVLILRVLSQSSSQLIKPSSIQMKSELDSIVKESHSIVKQMKEKFDPFSDHFQQIDHVFSYCINRSTEVPKRTDYCKQHQSKSFRIYEIQQVLKLMDNTNKNNLRKVSIRESERNDCQLNTTTALIVSYCHLFILNHNLELNLKLNTRAAK